MTEQTFDWRLFLTRWSEEWADVHTGLTSRQSGGEGAGRPHRLGFDPAPEERIAAMEEELGCALPPSYREFLAVSDGWRHAGGFVYRLAGTDEARWHLDGHGISEYWGEDGLAGMWERALQLDVESDLVLVLLDPEDRDADGEWAAYSFASWRAAPPERFGSFRAFMEAMYREFHRSATSDHGEAFRNATTREQDARVEAARLDALAGASERAEAALAEAAEFGRPRAVGLYGQLRRLRGPSGHGAFGALPHDSRLLGEVVAVLAADHVRSGRDDASWGRLTGILAEGLRGEADAVLRQVRERTFRYTAPGPFGEAVERAREQARWGGTEAAWRTLRAALPQWTPVAPDHLAPVGLLADPLLGPLLTPERGHELLGIPRGGAAVPRPTPVAAADGPDGADLPEEADGLAWLAAEPTSGGRPEPYRFVLVEGVAPDALPVVVAADEAARLDPPTSRRDPAVRRPAGGGFVALDGSEPAVVGRAGDAATPWSFAFDLRPSRFDVDRFTSPAAAVSGRTGGRVVAVFVAPQERFFHLSVAGGGEERYGFTARGTAVDRTGREAVPAALDPDGHFGPDRHGRQGECEVLAALAVEFGVSLPRFALTEGRLHTFANPSWAPPRTGSGESYLTVALLEPRSPEAP
ncbi:SMI1/KNR4 family protein [Kitasatospora sp. NPDC002965]|uniref:SMI1/KNR4 family protein n=1 Tax=Kitasatospora sp. NPDC002965 TaxID=3154775 RepID=UPI0033A2C1D8